ncbi:MAG: arylsulfatase [Segetibacter sp.]
MRSKIKIIQYFLSILLILTSSFLYSQSASKVDKRPNIIIILADDMGFSDIGCYGGEIQTPNIDYLASKGLRFSQFYNASRCCPTRAALLTGLYNHQAGIGNMSFDQQQPGYRGYLTENTITIAELLRSGGYKTGMVGKWHVANTKPLPDKKEHLAWLNHQADKGNFAPLDQYPTARGFDKYYGNIWGVVNFFDPFSLVNGTEPVKSVPKDFYYTDAINDTASAYIKEFSKSEKPFFLYVAQTAPHWPLHALPEDIKKYENTYKIGWDAIREQRLKKMVEKGVFPANKNLLSPRYKGELKWDEYPGKEWEAYAMAVRAAMVDRMDQGIGRIIKTLRETGELDNTLILFLSDNGASCDDAQDYRPGLDRPGETRTGKQIIYPVDKSVLPGPETTFASTDTMWSNVANTPFRYWKMESYEGGICTPMVAFWPEGIKAKPGSVTTQVGHVIDFMATVKEMSGVTYPSIFKGNNITPTEGESLLPIFKNGTRKGHEYIFFEHVRGRAVRYGDWKLVTLGPKRQWELYNIKNDRTETNNVAAEHPDLVEKLKNKWNEWANKNKVLPKPDVKSKE